MCCDVAAGRSDNGARRHGAAGKNSPLRKQGILARLACACRIQACSLTAPKASTYYWLVPPRWAPNRFVRKLPAWWTLSCRNQPTDRRQARWPLQRTSGVCYSYASSICLNTDQASGTADFDAIPSPRYTNSNSNCVPVFFIIKIQWIIKACAPNTLVVAFIPSAYGDTSGSD